LRFRRRFAFAFIRACHFKSFHWGTTRQSNQLKEIWQQKTHRLSEIIPALPDGQLFFFLF
jgi:hypothetical protein